MRFARAQFFDGFRQRLDSTINQSQVDGIEFLLAAFESTNWTISEISYALATIFHETAKTMQPITEFGSRSYFNKYDGRADLGNAHAGDGYRFRGRGYVQLTGRKNYTRYGIQDEPEAALDPETAFRIMTDGMRNGRYTGKKLSDYISDTGKDYKNARKIINGLDRADLIAGYARTFEEILRESKTNSAAAPDGSAAAIPPAAPGEPVNIVNPASHSDLSHSTEQPPIGVKKTEAVDPTTIIETIKPAGDPPDVAPVQVSQNGPLAKWIAGGGGLTAIGTMIWGFIQSNLNAVAIAIICITLLIIVIIFRGAITDAIRMQTAADPDKKNVS